MMANMSAIRELYAAYALKQVEKHGNSTFPECLYSFCRILCIKLKPEYLLLFMVFNGDEYHIKSSWPFCP